MSTQTRQINQALDAGQGILCLVPDSFCIPGKRSKQHPDDYYAFGANRGGIDERWFASTTNPYGLIIMQGHDSLSLWPVKPSLLIRFGQPTQDEYFTSTAAAAAGVKIHNPSLTEPPVRLKHFGPIPEVPQKS